MKILFALPSLFLLASASARADDPSGLRGSQGPGRAVAIRNPPQDQDQHRNLQSLITRFDLINASTNQAITEYTPIVDGAVIKVPSGTPLNVQAIVTGDMTGALVQFSYNDSVFRTEKAAPYAFCGDSSGNYNTCTELVPGPAIKMKAQVIKNGSSVSSMEVTFTITNGDSTPPPPVPVAPTVTTPVVPPTPAPAATPVAVPVAVPVTQPVPPAPTPAGSLPWIESFAQVADGTTADGGPTSWTATRAKGNFDVQGEALRVNDGGSEAVFMTGEIDISGTSVDVSIDLYSVGNLESNQDYVGLYIKVDNQAEQLIDQKWGIQPAGTKMLARAVTGNKLTVVIRAYVSFGDEFYFIDNVSVSKSTGSAPTPAPVAAPVAPTPQGCGIPEVSSHGKSTSITTTSYSELFFVVGGGGGCCSCCCSLWEIG